MNRRRRLALALVAPALLAALASSGRHAAKAQDQARAVPRPVLSNGVVPIGSLGHPLGSYITIEGITPDEGEVLKWSPWITIRTVNGKPLDEPIPMPVHGFDVDALKPGTRCVFKGYETGKMIGQPPAIGAAAREEGKPPPPGPAAGWQIHLDFHVLKAVEPMEKG